MTDVDPRRARFGSLLAVALVALTLLAVGGVGTVAADDVDLTCAGTGGGAAYVTDSNLTVYENASNVTHGNFTGNETVDFGNVSVSARDNASLRLENATGNVTCLSGVNATNATITVVAGGEGTFHLDGNATGLSVREPVYATGNGAADLAYNASDGLTLRINETDLGAGETVAAVDIDTESELARGDVAANGSVTLSLPAGTHDVDARRVVNTGGGGGGGDDDDDDENSVPGVDAQPDVQVETQIVDVEPGQSSTTVAVEGSTAVDRVTLEDAVGGSVTVSEFETPPETVREGVTTAVDDAETVVSAVDISPDADGGDSGGGSVTLVVDRDDLERPDEAVIAHETDEGWERLETTVASTDGPQVTLRASVESFSLFAVVQTASDRQATATATETPRPDETIAPSTAASAETPTATSTVATAATPPTTSTGTPGFGAGVAVLAILVVASVGIRRR